MARIRKFAAYRKIERPYTRTSKFRKKSYVKARPNCRVVRFDMGEANKYFEYKLELRSKSDMQVRDNALESARQTCNRVLTKRIGKNLGFKMRMRTYPHHILRENPLASGAGADRMSTGMKCSFGKAIGNAARVKTGQTVIEVNVNKENLETGKLALKRAQFKMPFSCMIQMSENKK